MHKRLSKIWYFPVGMILGVGFLVYFNALPGLFVFDDQGAIVSNPTIRKLWPPWAPFSWIRNTPVVAGRPLINFSFALNYAVSGLNPLGYHLVNLLIHLFNGILVYFLANHYLHKIQVTQTNHSIFDSRNHINFWIAFLWILHPVHNEIINYTSQRTEALMSTFFLLTLLMSARVYQTQRISFKIAAVTSCFAGILCKEVMVVCPVVVMLTDIFFSARSWKEILSKGKFFYLSLFSSWIVLLALAISNPRGGSVGESSRGTAFNYLMNQAIIITDYLKFLLYPHPHVIDYGYSKEISWTEASPYGLFIFLLLGLVMYGLFRWPKRAFLGLCFFLILAPTSSFITMNIEVGAERRLYLPALCFIILTILALFRATTPLQTLNLKFENGQRLVFHLICFLLALTYGLINIDRNRDYNSQISIWKSAAATRPENPRAHYNLGYYYLKPDKQEYNFLAAQHFQKAIELDSGYFQAMNNLGIVYTRWEQYDRSIFCYKQALKLHPGYSEALFNLSFSLFKQKRLEEGITALKKVIQISPNYKDAHKMLAKGLIAHSKIKSNYESMSRQKATYLEDPPFLLKLGQFASSLGKHQEALGHFSKAIRIQPRLPGIHSLIGKQYFWLQDYKNAERSFSKAVQFNPKILKSRHDLLLARIAVEYTETFSLFKNRDSESNQIRELFIRLEQNARLWNFPVQEDF